MAKELLSDAFWARIAPLLPPGGRLFYTRDMTIKRLDHVSVVVDDLAAAIAFFHRARHDARRRDAG